MLRTFRASYRVLCAIFDNTNYRYQAPRIQPVFQPVAYAPFRQSGCRRRFHRNRRTTSAPSAPSGWLPARSAPRRAALSMPDPRPPRKRRRPASRAAAFRTGRHARPGCGARALGWRALARCRREGAACDGIGEAEICRRIRLFRKRRLGAEAGGPLRTGWQGTAREVT